MNKHEGPPILIKSDARAVTTYVQQFLPDNPVIIEAGAFNGHDTGQLARFWPAGTIHAFEPVPQLFEKLTEQTKNLANVHCYQFALSDKTGTASFYIAEKTYKPGVPSQAGSLLKPKERLELSPVVFTEQIQVPTIILDEWAAKYSVDHVDFIWLDIQGHELAVLQAAPRILKTVKVIFIEVEFVEAYEGQPCYPEVKAWLEEQGFAMVATNFTDQTTWFFGNVVFVR